MNYLFGNSNMNSRDCNDFSTLLNKHPSFTGHRPFEHLLTQIKIPIYFLPVFQNTPFQNTYPKYPIP